MSQRRRKPLSPYLPSADDSITPLGYVLEWTPQSHHRHRLDTVDNLRSELLGGEPSGVEQLIVLRGDSVSADVGDALRSLAGVNGAFVDAFARGRPFRPRGRAGAAARWWAWRYPEETGGGGSVVVRTAALWLSSPTPVLLVDTPLEAVCKRHKSAPRLRHQDAATRRSALQHSVGGRYGAVARYPASPPQQHHHADSAPAPVKTLDDELASTVDHVQEVVLEEILAEIVYERWAACLGGLRLAEDNDGRDQRRRLWSYMVALERNLDDAQCCARQGRSVEHGAPAAWTDLSQRAQLRIQLASTSVSHHHHHRCSAAAAPRSSDDDKDRSLDRLAYLGGLLLPVSLVAGVLAIEGRYGPEGPQFWVFWAASAAAAVAVLLVIYLDQLRLDDVWVDVGGRGAAGEEEAGAAGLGVVVADGAKAKAAARAWRRERLGWARAVKRASGYYRLRGARWIRFASPEREETGAGEDVIVVEEER